MQQIKILSTVSAVALTAGIATSAQAEDAPNLIVDLTSPTIASAVGLQAGAFNDQSATGTSTTGVVTGASLTNTAEINDTGNTNVVNNNTIEALGISNQSLSEVDAGAVTGVGPADNGAAAFSLMFNGPATTFSATATGTSILDIDLDAGASANTFETDGNAITATVIGNDGETNIGIDIPGGATVDGVVNSGYTSDERGQVVFDTGEANEELQASASFLAETVQINRGVGGADPNPDVFSRVLDSEISIRVDDGGDGDNISIIDSTLSLDNNTIQADLTGNRAITQVALTDGDTTELNASAGALTAQENSAPTDEDIFNAEVLGEGGISAFDRPFPGTTELQDLVNSSLSVSDNTIATNALANDAVTSVATSGLNINGPNEANTNNSTVEQANEISLLGDSEITVEADLFAVTLQSNAIDVSATTGEGFVPGIRTDVDGLADSSLTFTGNGISATAGANRSVSTVTVNTPAGDSAFVNLVAATNNTQFTTSDVAAATQGSFTIVTADTFNGDDVTDSSITVDGNVDRAGARGNEQASALVISATTIDSDAFTIPTDPVVNRANDEVVADADFTVVNAQLVDEGAAISATAGSSIFSSLVDSDNNITGSELSVSGNQFTSEAIGNLSTEASLTLDGNNISGRGAVINAQTVEDDVTISALTEPRAGADDVIYVLADVADFANNSLDIDNNVITATLFGNLADGSTNSISITGNSVDDNGQEEPQGLVGQIGTPGTGPSDSAHGLGYGVINNQSVEDVGLFSAGVSTSASEDQVIFVEVGQPSFPASAADMTGNEISVDTNRISSAATFNAATNRVDIEANALDASSGIVNSQGVVDDGGAATSAQMSSEVIGDTTSGRAIDVQIDAGDAPPGYDNNAVTVNGNRIESFGTINSADNDVAVTANTQTLSASASDGDADVRVGLDNGIIFDTIAQGETLIANDQFFESLTFPGHVVRVIDSGIALDVTSVSGTQSGNTSQVNGNVIAANAIGNTASNTITLDVNNFDLSAAEETSGDPGRGPVASIASNQQALNPGAIGTDGRINSSIDDSSITLNQIAAGDSTVIESELTVDDNLISALARVNFAENDLAVSGQNFAATDTGAVTGTVELAGDDVALTGSSFTVGNRQVSGLLFATSNVQFLDIANTVDTDEIIGTTISTSNNAILSQARGNDAVNTLELDYGTNEAAALVGNLQGAGVVNPRVGARVANVNIGADAVDTTFGVIDSTLQVDGNQILALASFSRASNTLSSTGTNLGSSIDEATLQSTAGTVAAGGTIAGADYGIINRQGSLPGGDAIVIETSISFVTIEANAATGPFNNSTLSVDDNVLLAQSVSSDAVNTLTLGAVNPGDPDAANIGASGESVSASILSRQVESGSNPIASVSDFEIGSIGSIGDIDSSSSSSITVNRNVIRSESRFGEADNTMIVNAGAGITGVDGTGGTEDLDTSLTLGDGDAGSPDDTVNADYTILNQQTTPDGLGADVGASVGPNLDVGVTVGTEADNDTVTVDNNLVEADGIGFSSINIIDLTAGAALDATAQVANRQSLFDSGVRTTVFGLDATSEGIYSTFAGPEATSGSNLSVSNNDIRATAQGNVATNALLARAGASIATTATEAGEATLSSADLTVDNSAFTVANRQLYEGGETTSQIGVAGFPGLRIGSTVTGGLTDSSLNVDGNDVIASTTRNQALNTLVVASDATIEGSAGLSAASGSGFVSVANADAVIANQQANINASIPPHRADIGGLNINAEVAGALNGSSVSVDGNRVIGQIVGNDATNALLLSAGAGNDLPSAAVVNSQTNQNVILSSTIADITIGVSGVTGASGSSTTVSGNTVGATAVGNRSFNSIGASN